MIQLTDIFDDQGTIVRFLGEDIDTGDTVLVVADHRPARDIIEALQDDREVLVDPEPWAVRTLVKGDRS